MILRRQGPSIHTRWRSARAGGGPQAARFGRRQHRRSRRRTTSDRIGSGCLTHQLAFASMLDSPASADILADLQEDFVTAWVPDALAGVDFPMLIGEPNAVPDRSAILSVPRPGRSSMQVPVLGFDRQLALHAACEPIKAIVDGRLRPEVCGYRTGAASDPGYQLEYQRYRDFLSGGVKDHLWSGTADVESFFSSVTYDTLVGALGTLSRPSNTQALEMVLSDFCASDLPLLPAGYADARMLGNLVLAAVDEALDIPFTRWVDDYRLFSNDQSAVLNSLRRVDQGLRSLDLRANPKKQRVLSRDVAVDELIGRDLDSVFHPEVESNDASRKTLRRVLIDALADPVYNRRLIRFCLPRLAYVHDDFAVDFAAQNLMATPWDLPRLIQYLHVFRDRESVAEQLFSALASAVENDDDWATARICVGVAGLTVPESLVDSLTAYALHTASSAAWGLVARVLALTRSPNAVEVANRALDVRPSLACFRDLEESFPRELADRGLTTASVLEDVPVPLPLTFSLL